MDNPRITNTARVAERVACLMDANGVSVNALANKTGIARVTLTRRLTGTSSFTVSEIFAIAEALGQPITKLLPTEETAA